jgi:dTDP-4-dehydrorhamnose reductase
MKIVVLGASGMLGSMAYRLMSENRALEVHATARSADARALFAPPAHNNIIVGVDATDPDALAALLRDTRPDVVVNCIGVVKQLASANDPLTTIPLNAILPHRLARLCALADARLIHISTDCVFSGSRGNYRETDVPDAEDLYGRSKLLGEVDYPNAITLRTSIIGPEARSSNGLVAWFLSQKGEVSGYARAVFSGLTTDELTRLIVEHVIPRPELHGTYHVSSAPIDKYRLLSLIKDVYRRETPIVRDEKVVIDRSLDSTRFRELTGYVPPDWPAMVRRMHELSSPPLGN